MSIYRLRTEFGHQFKWILIGLALIFIVGAIWSFGPSTFRKERQNTEANAVIATVNGIPITQNEWDLAWNQAMEMIKNQGQGVQSTLQVANIRGYVFQQVIETRMMLAAAKNMGVEINKKDIDRERDKMIGEYLKRDRQTVLGKVPKSEEKLDPRNDSDYKDELKKNGMILDDRIKAAESMIPESQVEIQLAQKGIMKKLDEQAGRVSDDDVTNSYNIYSIHQIVLPKGNIPKEQFQTKVDKIAKEAKSGGDFVKLANANSMDSQKGKAVSFSYDNQFMFPPEVAKAIFDMKAGQVSNPIGNQMGAYIIKVDSITPKLPAKFDKKTRDERRKQILQMRKQIAAMAFQAKMREHPVVDIKLPELNGYYHESLAQQPGNDSKKEMSLAEKAYKDAITKDPGNDYATCKLVQILQNKGDIATATKYLYQMLEGANARAQGTDLRIMLGDMLAQAGKKAEAIQQYEKASDAAVGDKPTHQELVKKYQMIQRPDLVAKEQQWIAQYDQDLKAYQAQHKGQAPAAPASTKP